MSLALALNNALSGININQQALAVLSQNIANANTAGYSRKILKQESQYINGNGVGVRLQDITRRVDEYLIRSIRLQSSIAGRANTVDTYFERSQLLLGNPGASNALNSYTTNFFNALESLAQTPENGTMKTSAVNSGATLASRVSLLAQQLQDLRFEADQEIANAVPVINNALVQVYDLNRIIAQESALGKPVTELQDKRDQFINTISEYMDVQTYTRDTGAINISVNGVSLLDDSIYQLSYTAIASTTTLINNGNISALSVYRTDDNGAFVGSPVELISNGTSSSVVSAVTSGKLKGWLDMRDREIPLMLSQLDVYASTMRDQFNAIHNAGIAFPGANSYTGSRAVLASDYNQWAGKIRIAVLDENGQPIASPYSTQPNGFPPLTLDLSSLNSGFGAGKPSMQTIIDEINQYYGIPQNKAAVGNLSNIRLASNTTSLPGSPASFSFDLDLENLSINGSSVFVTGITVLDSTDTDITSITQNVPDFDIDPTTGFSTTSGSNVVTITTTDTHGLSEGDRIYLPDITAAIAPETDLNGIPLSELNGQYFTISNVTENGFDITVTSNADTTGAVASTGATVTPPYAEVDAGESRRTTDDGIITLDLTGNSTSPYYTITLDVAVDDGQGNLTTSQVTYRVTNSQDNLLNDRYAATDVSGQGELIEPNSNQVTARAILVDADGNELPRTNGRYTTQEQGYLKIIAGNTSYMVAIDSLDSSEEGLEGDSDTATNRGFSHYFGLNNFFVDDNAEDSLTNSALNLQVEQRLIDDPNLISTGILSLVSAENGYTYERTIGDQSVIQQLADLGLSNIAFAAAGGLGATTQTLSGYAGQIISLAATKATSASGDAENAQLLLDNFGQQSSSISGVNLDEELANTVIYQNAYAASARIVSVASDLFDTLLDTF